MTKRTKILLAILIVVVAGAGAYFINGEYFQGKTKLDLSKAKEVKQIEEVKNAKQKFKEYDLISAKDIEPFELPEGMFDFSFCNLERSELIYNEGPMVNLESGELMQPFKGEFINFYNYLKNEFDRNGGKLLCPLEISIDYKISLNTSYLENGSEYWGLSPVFKDFFVDIDSVNFYKMQYSNEDQYVITLSGGGQDDGYNIYLSYRTVNHGGVGEEPQVDIKTWKSDDFGYATTTYQSLSETAGLSIYKLPKDGQMLVY